MNRYGLSAQRLGFAQQAGINQQAQSGGLAQQQELMERKLTAAARDKINTKDFAVQGRRYPIQDKEHGANALSRASGKSIEGQVHKRVCSRYPDLPSCSEKKD